MSAPSHVSFVKWLDHSEIPDLHDRLAVGWSGGADSTALLLALKSSGYDVIAWHVDHAWRNTSERECAVLKARAKAWGIPFFSARLDAASGSNREAEARALRFGQFARWGSEQHISMLCLAHQRDDQAETVYMRLLQGAGAGGCSGMQRQRQFDRLNVVRPLLHLSAGELREVLREAGVDWFEDPSNLDMSIRRNSIRHQMFPAMHDAGFSPSELFLRWQCQAERLAMQLDRDADVVLDGALVADNKQGAVSLSWLKWRSCSPPVRARVLQKMMAKLLGAGKTPGRRHILMVESWTGSSGRGGLDLSGCRLQRKQAYLHLQPTCSVCAE